MPGRVAQSVGTWLVSQGSWVRYPVWQHTFVSPSAFSRRAVVSYWRKYVHEVLVNRLGGLSLHRKSVVRLTDRLNMTLDVYRARKTTIQQRQLSTEQVSSECRVTHKNDNSAHLYFVIMSPDPYFTSFSFPEYNSATIRNILMAFCRSMPMWSVTFKNNNSAHLYFLIMSPPSIFYFIFFSRAWFCNR